MVYNCDNCGRLFTSKDDALQHQMNRECQSGSRPRARSRSPVRAPGCSSAQQQRPGKLEIPEEPRGWEASERLTLDYFNSDLWLLIGSDGYGARPISDGGFANMWAGAKATHGVAAGRVYYEVRLADNNKEVRAPSEEKFMFLLRCGWSGLDAGMVLGEEPSSYGFGGTGKASRDNQFITYGHPFTNFDVVGCFLEYRDDGVPVISYSVNGEHLGVCFTATEARNKPLFPHVLTKNMQFEVNFGQRKPWYPPPGNWTPIGCLDASRRVRNHLPPEKREDCSMVMMCGLPAAGKSVWAEKHCAQHPERRYYVLGTNNIIDRLKIMGLPRQRNYHGRWEMLIEKSTKCLNTLFDIACKRKRNYILDQTNVYPSAQRRKMAPFEGYQRLAVVVVPTEDEYQRRLERQRRVEGKEVPESAIDTMKANFRIPSDSDGTFDEVLFPELGRVDAERLVAQYNREGAAKVAASGHGRGASRGGSASGFRPEVANCNRKPPSAYDGGCGQAVGGAAAYAAGGRGRGRDNGGAYGRDNGGAYGRDNGAYGRDNGAYGRDNGAYGRDNGAYGGYGRDNGGYGAYGGHRGYGGDNGGHRGYGGGNGGHRGYGGDNGGHRGYGGGYRRGGVGGWQGYR